MEPENNDSKASTCGDTCHITRMLQITLDNQPQIGSVEGEFVIYLQAMKYFITYSNRK